MYRIEDNFYPQETFDRILELVKTKPDNVLPENYNGKRSEFKNRTFLTEPEELSDLILSKFPFKENFRRRIEVANDVHGFFLHPHSDHPAKKDVTVLYIEGRINSGTTFDGPIWEETVDFFPNRAVHFMPDEKQTFDPSSRKHSVKLQELRHRRTVVVSYVDSEWRDTHECYD